MKRLLVFVFAVVLLGSCNKKDYTEIPDPVFEQHLIDLGYDDIIDEQVLTSNIINVDSLEITPVQNNFTNGISSLVGIQDFSSLIYLNCSGNDLSILDLSSNTALTELYCSNNRLLSNLDLSFNTDLTILSCSNTDLISLDLSQNTLLSEVRCFNNSQLNSIEFAQGNSIEILHLHTNQQLANLDLSSSPNLSQIYCMDNNLNCLNLKNGNNTNIGSMGLWLLNNPNLSCVEVDDSVWSTNNWTVSNYNIDSGVTFSTNCNYPAGCF